MDNGIEKKSMEALQRMDVSTFKQGTKVPIVVVLDNVRSAFNVGSVFRTADAFSIEKIYLCGITASGDNREVLKTALGATNSIMWEHTANPTDTIKQLKQKGYTIWAVEQAHNSIALNSLARDTSIPNPLVLVFGNEVNGVDAEVLKQCDGCIEIPQFGTKHSLNISVSAGIVLWHLSLIFSQTSARPS